jgi:hypothetical protein
LIAVTVASSEEKLMNHQKLFDSAISVADWLKSAPDNPKWINQKEDLIQSANNFKKRRSLISKKRDAKRDGSNISKPLYNASKQQKQVLVTNLNTASLKLIQLFQSWGGG